MFSNTAYEALYQIIGLELHSKFISVITGETFFKGLILIIFGIGFFFTAIKFISRYIPGSLVERRHLPLSKFIRVIACLFLGLAILRVGSDAHVKDFQGKSWAENPYVQSRHDGVSQEYRVSFVFQLLSQTAEEITGLLSRVIDSIFQKGNSQLAAPNLFYKAIMYAGAESVDDPKLRDGLKFYTEECFSKVIPSVEAEVSQSAIDRMFTQGHETDRNLADIKLEMGNGRTTDCLSVKEEVRQHLIDYASQKSNGLPTSLKEQAFGSWYDATSYWNYTASMALVNYYLDQREGRLGVQKGAETPGTTSSVFRVLNRFVHWDGWLGLFGLRDSQGASEAASRSQEFSEHLARAPHVAGFIKMILIALFPWLMFFVVAGYWRVLLIWFWIYFSVLMWTPLWTLLYHVTLNIAMSGEVLQAFGELNDGISLYSAALVNSRLYYMFSIYSWAQLLVATMTTGSVFVFLKPMLGESDVEAKPEFMEPALGAATTAAKAVL